VLDAAIGAAGGADKLDKLKTVRVKIDATVPGEGNGFTLSGEGTLHGLDHFRFDLEAAIANETVKFSYVLQGNKSWGIKNDRVLDTPAEVIPLFKAELHAFRAAHMLTPLKGKDMKLSPLGEIKIDKHAALGIKIVRKNHPDLDLYFDKETHLPIKCGQRLKEPGADQDVLHEWLFSDYKEMGGVKHAKKVVMSRDGKKTLDLEIKEVKPEEKVDENLFAKP
jgi:hypothetical protein